MNEAPTPAHDPRYSRAQTVDGAKSRFVYVSEYTLADLESDIDRLLAGGEYPDRSRPQFDGQPMGR